jgi:hypothetical protein
LDDRFVSREEAVVTDAQIQHHPVPETSPLMGVAIEPDFQREAAAHHEAGHAVIATRRGWWIDDEGVEIGDRWYCGMQCFVSDNTTDRAVGIFLAGWLAEYKFHGLGGPRHDNHLIYVIDAVRGGWADEVEEAGDDAVAMQRLIDDDPDATAAELIGY